MPVLAGLDVCIAVHAVAGEDREVVAVRLFSHGCGYVGPGLRAAGAEAMFVDMEEGDQEGIFLWSPDFGALLGEGRHIWCEDGSIALELV
jgi:hypothetical protein